MYVVNIKNGADIIPIQNAKHKLFTGNVVQGINTIDSFQFSILKNNPAFGNLHEFTTLVEVINTSKNRTEFYGRVLLLTPEMNDKGLITQNVVCENYFGFFCDSQQEYVATTNWRVDELFNHIISCHNSQIEDYKKFKVVIDDSLKGILVYEGIQRENTWETIKKKLLDKVGGEIVLSVENGENVITYTPKAGETKTTKIALSKNMKSIRNENDPSAFITRLIPLGAKLNDNTEERLEIDIEEDANYFDGICQVYANKNYIDDVDAIRSFGVRVGYVEFDGVTGPLNLLNKGLNWIRTNNKVLVKYSITALDLSILGLDIDDFQIYNSYPIENKLLNIFDTVRITKKNIDVCDEVKSSFEIGDKFKTASELRLEAMKSYLNLFDALVKENEENKESISDIRTSIGVTDTGELVKIQDTYIFKTDVENLINQALTNSGFVTEDEVKDLINNSGGTGGDDSGDSGDSGDTDKCKHTSWTEWEVVVAPTCTTTGYKRRRCKECGEEEIVAIAATGHSPGGDGGDICTVCGLPI